MNETFCVFPRRKSKAGCTIANTTRNHELHEQVKVALLHSSRNSYFTFLFFILTCFLIFASSSSFPMSRKKPTKLLRRKTSRVFIKSSWVCTTGDNISRRPARANAAYASVPGNQVFPRYLVLEVVFLKLHGPETLPTTNDYFLSKRSERDRCSQNHLVARYSARWILSPVM